MRGVVRETPSTVALLDHVAAVPDPRSARQRWHKLSDIWVIAVCAVLCGAESYPAIEDFGHERAEWLKQLGELPEGIPSHDTCKRVLRLLDPVPLQACFLRWRQAVAEVTAGEIVASAGQALRRSFAQGTGKRAIPMGSAWVSENGAVLGQRKVDTKANEITAIPELLDLWALNGGIVTMDAMGCQRTLAQKIGDQGADYVLALKGNQPTLEQAVERCFVTGPEAEAYRTQSDDHEQTEQGHGRVETRCAWLSADLEAALSALAWPGLQSLGRGEATRTLGGKTSVEQRFYLSRLPPEAEQFAQAVRNHGGIENQLPWRLDVTFREDLSRLRTGHGAENFAVLRHSALNLLRQEPSAKSLPRKRLAGALNPDYLLKVLLGKQF
jgi:predicted transposase YbfD/YdcC